MSVHRPYVISAHPALRLAGLVMVIAGLLGVHGLTGPGGFGMDRDRDAAMTVRTLPSAVISASSLAVASSGVATTAIVVQTQDGPLADQARRMGETLSGLGRGGMALDIAMMMCAAVLGAALIAVPGFLRAGRATPVVWSLPRRRPRPIRYRDRDPGPPFLTELSVQRC